MLRKIIVISLVLMGFIITGCNIEGEVTYNDEPIEGITVTLERGSTTKTVKTDENGKYKFSNVSNGRCTISAVEGCSHFESESIEFYKGAYDVKNKDIALEMEADLKIWEGNCIIDSQEDIEAVSGYMTIKGDLLIGTEINLPTTFKNVDGLECLRKVQGSLFIHFNPVLENVNGLRNLCQIGGKVTIWKNESLENLEGLENILPGSDVVIYDNDELTGLELFENLTAISGLLIIWGNGALATLEEMETLTSIGDSLQIIGNNSLCTYIAEDLRDLIGVGNIGGSITITDNKVCD